MQRLEYTGRIADQMAGAVEHREHIGLGLSDRSKSLVKTRRSPQRKSPHRRERSPTRRRSPTRARSPKGASSSHRRSPPKEKVPDRIRSPTHVRERSPVRTSPSRSLSPRTKRSRRSQTEREPEKAKGGEHLKSSRGEQNRGGEGEFKEKRRTSSSHSPSPRSKRLMQAQAEREGEKIKSWEHGGNSSREGRDGRNSRREIRDKGRYGEHGEARDALSEKPSRDKNDGGSSKASRRDRPFSPEEHSHWSKHDSPSPSRASRAGRREELSKSRASEQFSDDDLDSVTKMKAAEESLEAKEKDKQKPSFELSGKLAEETNRVRGVTLLFNEPAEARKPDIRWRLYVFKAGEVLNEPLYVHRQSCYLFGRERRVADIPTDHPSCSKQHAVIQYRLVEKEQPDGLLSKQVRPYLMDLGSTNGTFINDNRIEAQRYYELFEKDTIRFGNSSREYVILHENSAT